MSHRVDGLPRELKALHTVGILRDLDLYLVETLLRQCQGGGLSGPLAAPLALALASRTIGWGHVCLDMSAVTPEWMARLHPGRESGALPLPAGIAEACRMMADPVLRSECFLACGAVVGTPRSGAPFVLDGNRLYLRRYWDYEQQVASKLVELARSEMAEHLPPDIEERLGPPLKANQKQAVLKALTRRLTVITGGPGTGKTYTAALILSLLTQGKRSGGGRLRIRMAAPTGKAAAKMDESLRDAIKQNPGLQVEPACTLERLLGFMEGTPYFRFNASHPLPADVVLVDEASMIDLAKMAKLLEALSPTTRLVLLGDRHQLASVQPGSVLAEICESEVIAPCIAHLTESVRFGPGSPVGRLSAAVNEADTAEQAVGAWALVRTFSDAPLSPNSVRQYSLPDALVKPSGDSDRWFAQCILAGYREFLAADTPEQAFEALSGFRVLCALRSGPLGVVRVNRAIEDILSLRTVRPQLVPPELWPQRKLNPGNDWYSHRVVMVTRNDYSLPLFNGDVGVVLPDPECPGEWGVFFERPVAPAAGESRYRNVPRRLLPEHETAFAMTIHKAQGSEFGHVLILLPHLDHPVLTRELLYTAITRTQGPLELGCHESIFKQTVMRKTRRTSGLREALRTQGGSRVVNTESN